jgi:peptidyl-prolyl cis-trans isomerase SurA
MRRLGVALLWFVACAPDRPKTTPPPYDVRTAERDPVATVDGVEVGRVLFNLRFASRFRRGGSITDAVAIKRALAAEMIDEALVERAAKRRELTPSQTDEDAAWRALQASFATPALFNKYLASYPQQVAGVRATLRQSLLREALAGVKPNDPVSDADARAVYQQTISVYETPAHVVAVDWSLPVPSPDLSSKLQGDAAAALQAARDPKTPLETLGPRFGAQVKVLSNASAETLEPALWKALSPLKPGQLTRVVATPAALHILLLRAREAARHVTFAQARPGIDKLLRIRRRSDKVAALLVSLRKGAHIDNLLEKRLATLMPLRPIAPFPPASTHRLARAR